MFSAHFFKIWFYLLYIIKIGKHSIYSNMFNIKKNKKRGEHREVNCFAKNIELVGQLYLYRLLFCGKEK